MRPSRRSAPLVCAVLLVGGGAVAQAPPTKPAPEPAAELDREFFEAYRQSRGEAKRAASPLIVVSGNELTLFRGDASETRRVIPALYHSLKSISHVPLALFLRLKPLAGTAIPESAQAGLRAFRQKIEAAKAALPSGDLTQEQASRQASLLDASFLLISQVLRDGRVERSRVDAFAGAMGPLTLANVDEAACAQIRAMHEQTTRWRSAMTKEEWATLRVVIRGRHQPRIRNVATQYFSRLLGDAGPAWAYPGESMRVVYAEDMGGDEAGDVLATVLVDADIGAAFFGDAWRMSEDLLSGGARNCLDRLLPTAPPSVSR
jgi:hypothetical protein